MIPRAPEAEPKHPLPLWGRWLILIAVLLLVIGLAILWIIQGAQALIPVVVITVIGVVLAFFQVFPPTLLLPEKEPSIKIASTDLSSSHVSTTLVDAHRVVPAILTTSPASANNTVTRAPDVDQSTSVARMANETRIDWDGAPQQGKFYGRLEEFTTLEKWIEHEHCCVLSILGQGGIGKTSLAVALVNQVNTLFDYVFWRTLQNAPPLREVLKESLLFFSEQQITALPENEEAALALLFDILKKKRCLLIFDNLETILQDGNHASLYQYGYEDYDNFIRRFGTTRHSSCLLLTSREKTKELVLLESASAGVRSLSVAGLDTKVGRAIIEDGTLFGSDDQWSMLVQIYSGNPLALKLVCEFIREIFGGNIEVFLRERDGSTGIHALLDQQFKRLSALELEIIYWLAVERERVSLEELRVDLVTSVIKKELLDALLSLRRRFLIETTGSSVQFTLLPLIMEHVADVLVDQIYEEFLNEDINIFGKYALMKADAKEHVRESQIRFFLAPLAKRLLDNFGESELQQKCQHILSLIHTFPAAQPTYAAGNMLSLLIFLKFDLEKYDFSHLFIRQAYLQKVNLSNVNFRSTHFDKSMFTDTLGNILSLSFAPVGDLVAGGTTTSSVRIWRWQGMHASPHLDCTGHTDWVRSVTFSPDSNVLASCGNDQTIRLWDVNTGICLSVLRGHNSWVRQVIFSPDGKVLASCGNDQTIRLWDVATRQCMHILQGHEGEVRSIAFSPDGTRLVSGSQDKTVRFWDLTSRDCLAIVTGHTSEVWSVAFSPDSRFCASASDDQTIRVWDSQTHALHHVLTGHTRRVRSVAFHPLEPLLISASEDQTIRQWDTLTGQRRHTLVGHTGWIRSIAFNADGSVLASGGDDQTIRLWETNTNHCLTALSGHSNWIKTVAFSPDERLLASNSDTYTLSLWQTEIEETAHMLTGHNSWVRTVAFSPDGNLLASGSEDTVVRLWNVRREQYVKTLRGHHSWVTSVAFSPDGNVLASASEDASICLWNIQTGKAIHTLTGHTHRVGSIAFSPDGTLLASAGDDQKVRLWNVQLGTCLTTLHGHTSRVRSVAFSPDGRFLASASGDHTVRVWQTDTWRCLHILLGHTNWVRSVAIGADAVIASGSDDRTIRLWDARTGECIQVLEGHADHVRAVAFNGQGNHLASGSRDGSIRLWDVPAGTCYKILKCDRPYEHMDITGASGLTEVQRETLKVLGAIDH
ncbi:NB-ARC domain-containing protein [Dictyobacter arantiisoli]|uniref:NB-ARC domain-containing protein n=1 Tax=Dictyobacter arantiisoli TaxID=2014874 RepID=A0A5A5TD34_9CHLR|nr:NB-ARC domain-containing protein [Dictyobacter arantiisoli]GCF08943.1 hypothetical protein KDI_25070 [Dictyobacter arantiisoli]